MGVAVKRNFPVVTLRVGKSPTVIVIEHKCILSQITS